MTDDINRIKDDISFMRSLAEDDGSVLRALGYGLVLGGIIFGLLMLRFTAIDAGWLDYPEPLRALMPWDAIAIFFAAFIGIALYKKRGVKRSTIVIGATSRAVWASWAAVGIGHVVAQFAMSRAGVDLSGVTLFVFWGGGWLVVWAVYRQLWLAFLVAGCYAVAIGAGFTWGTPYAGLLSTLGFFVLVALPGFKILQLARAQA